MDRPLFIPVILGTARKGRESEHAAKFVFEQTKKRAGVESEFIDVRTLPMKLDDAGEQMKDPKFSATIERCRRFYRLPAAIRTGKRRSPRASR